MIKAVSYYAPQHSKQLFIDDKLPSSTTTMLSKLRSKSKKNQFEAYDVTISLISCVNLKISGAGEEALTVNNETDAVKLYASFVAVASDEGIPLTIDGIAGNTHVMSKPLIRTNATQARTIDLINGQVDTTAMWGDNQRSCTAARFSHNVPKKKKKNQSIDVDILLGLMKGEESCPVAVTTVHIDPSVEDTMLTLPVQAAPHPKKRESKRSRSFMKRRTKDEPQQPVLLKHFDLQPSVQEAKLNVRVQVRGRGREKGESNASAVVEEARHDVDTRGATFEEKREALRIVEQEKDDQHLVAEKAAHQRPSVMENVLRGFSCENILTCQGVKEEFKSDGKPKQESSAFTDVVDKTSESNWKKMVENVRKELEIGHTASESCENESVDASYAVGPTTTIGAEDEPQQPVLLKHFDLQPSVQEAKLNVRVQVRGRGREKGESNASAVVEEARHDVDTRGATFEEKREALRIVEQEKDDQHLVAEKAAHQRPSVMENVLRGFSCENILTCQGVKEEFKSDGKPKQESSAFTDVVDKTSESNWKKMVENVRKELEIGHTASESCENESVDASYAVGPTTTIGADTYNDEEHTLLDDEGTKQERYIDDSSYDDTFTSFDNTVYSDDVTFGCREDDSTLMGGHIFM